jgi:hypothetical protein
MTAIRLLQNTQLVSPYKVNGGRDQVIDVPGEIADFMVASQSAVYVGAPVPAKTPVAAPVITEEDLDRLEAVAAGAEEPLTELSQPKPYAAKQEWINWALSRGADPGVANWTKADIMSRYGSRL